MIERPKPGAASTFQLGHSDPGCPAHETNSLMRRAFSCARRRRNPARGPASRNARVRRPARPSPNPAHHTFRSAARAFFPGSRSNHSAPRAPCSATRVFCSTRRAGEAHAPSFFLGPPSNFPDRLSYFPRPPSARAWRAGEFSRPSRLFSPRPERCRPPAGKISRHARLFVRALQLCARLGTWRPLRFRAASTPDGLSPGPPLAGNTFFNPSGQGEPKVPARWSTVFKHGDPPSGW